LRKQAFGTFNKKTPANLTGVFALSLIRFVRRFYKYFDISAVHGFDWKKKNYYCYSNWSVVKLLSYDSVPVPLPENCCSCSG
jgi:hypothetical protein